MSLERFEPNPHNSRRIPENPSPLPISDQELLETQERDNELTTNILKSVAWDTRTLKPVPLEEKSKMEASLHRFFDYDSKLLLNDYLDMRNLDIWMGTQDSFVARAKSSSERRAEAHNQAAKALMEKNPDMFDSVGKARLWIQDWAENKTDKDTVDSLREFRREKGW